MRKSTMMALAAIAAAFAIPAAARMSGYYDTWLGYCAGEGAVGTRTTNLGAAAGAEAYNTQGATYIGVGAGMRSTNMVDCIGIGRGALAYSSDCSNVVAIATSKPVTNANSRIMLGDKLMLDYSDPDYVKVEILARFGMRITEGEFYGGPDSAVEHSSDCIYSAFSYGLKNRNTMDEYDAGQVLSTIDAHTATLANMQCSLCFTNGEFQVWTNGVKAGTLAFTPAN